MVDRVEMMLIDRGRVYGDFLSQAAIASDIKQRMMADVAWFEDLAPDQREALEMIAVKIARILNGDPNYADNWLDIAGYASLVANRLKGSDEG